MSLRWTRITLIISESRVNNMHWFKSCGQNKINYKILAISILFLPYFSQKRLFFGGFGTSHRTQILAIIKTIAYWQNNHIGQYGMSLPFYIVVFAKNRKNVVQQWKRNWKICFSLKVMAETKLTSKWSPFTFIFTMIWPEKDHS